MNEITQEMKNQMKNLNVEQMTRTEVDNVITIRNINIGKMAEEEFENKIKFGIEMPKEGRIPLTIVEENIPTIWEEISNITGNPKDTISTGMFTELLLTNDKEYLKKFFEAMKTDSERERFKTMRKEAKTVVDKGLKWNDSLIWDIWKIIRSRKQRVYLENNGDNVDFLIALYSYIPEVKQDKIKERYDARFN